MSKKILQDKYPEAQVKKVRFGSHDFQLTVNNTTYHILKLNVHESSILSINSKHIWQVKYGKANGLSFKTRDSKLFDMREFNKLDNKIIVFKNKPYKILKYLNENEVIDISDESEINNIKIYNKMKEINV